ncbi:MAG: PaaI family thioesterase [bacterium]
MTEERGRPDANGCFVCGPDNPIGLQIAFRLEGEVCRGEFTPAAHHQGYDGVTHGGILFSLLDDVMANWLFLRGARAYTARSEIRYREAVPIGAPLRLEGRMIRKKGRFVVLEGKALREGDGAVVADAEATFRVEDPGPGGLPGPEGLP